MNQSDKFGILLVGLMVLCAAAAWAIAWLYDNWETIGGRVKAVGWAVLTGIGGALVWWAVWG